MAINVKVVERPTEDVSYIRAALKGMALTVKHLFDVNGRVTTQYPEEKSPISPRWRGTHRMLTTETAKRDASPAGFVRRYARPTASSWCLAKTRRATAIPSCSKSMSSAAFSVVTARKS